jgi:prevent-host-death family protein
MDDESLINLLREQSSQELSVQEARNRFIHVLHQARDGKASLIGSKEKGLIVVISVRNLTELMTNVIG